MNILKFLWFRLQKYIQDLLYNSKKSCGAIYVRHRYKQDQHRLLNVRALAELPPPVEHLTDEEKKKHLLFLKTCVMPRDEEEVKKVMKQTVELRRELKKTTEFGDFLKFYVTAPNLVSFLRPYILFNWWFFIKFVLFFVFFSVLKILFDYELTFGTNKHSIVSLWPNIEEILSEQLRANPDLLVGEYNQLQLECFLVMLKHLRIPRFSFKKSFDNLVIFVDVSFIPLLLSNVT